MKEHVEKFIQDHFPCIPPCDSFGVCENCSEAKLIRIGAELQMVDAIISTGPKPE